MTYPEKIPSEKVSSFNFSFSQISSARKSVEKDYENVVERINKIVDSEKFYINGFPVLKNITLLNPSKNDLKLLSKACDRLADLVEIQRTLGNKLIAADVAKEHPHWFTDAFGDFSQEIETDLESLFED